MKVENGKEYLPVVENHPRHMDIKEFRAKGYLQEVNRQFFHPLGLALEVQICEDGTELLGGVWDYRDSEEGVYFDIANFDDERIVGFKKKKIFVEVQQKLYAKKRFELFGAIVEPITKAVNNLFNK